MSNETFAEWLEAELKQRDWTPADLSREAGIGRGTLSDIFSGRRKAGAELATSIAKALKMPPAVVFIAAGLLPPDKKLNPKIAEIVEELQGMTSDEQQEFLAYIRFRSNQRKKK
jgi:transcriptional regulator with XRE-family HTH domain